MVIEPSEAKYKNVAEIGGELEALFRVPEVLHDHTREGSLVSQEKDQFINFDADLVLTLELHEVLFLVLGEEREEKSKIHIIR